MLPLAGSGKPASWCGTRKPANRTWTGQAHVVRAIAVSADNKLVAVENGYGQLRVYDLVTGKEPRQYRVESPGQPQFTSQGQLLVADRTRVRRWDVATGKELPALDAHAKLSIGLAVATNGTTVATYAPDGKRLATAGPEAAPRFWDSATGKETLRYEGHQRAVQAGQFTPDSKALLTASSENSVRRWDLASGQPQLMARGEAAIESLAIAPEGGLLATSTRYSRTQLWDRRTGKMLRVLASRELDAPSGPVFFSADGKTLAAGTGLGMVRFWDVATARELRGAYAGQIEPRGDAWSYVRFVLAPEGRSIAATRSQFAESGVVLWDVRTRTENRKLAGRGEPVAFSPDGPARGHHRRQGGASG